MQLPQMNASTPSIAADLLGTGGDESVTDIAAQATGTVSADNFDDLLKTALDAPEEAPGRTDSSQSGASDGRVFDDERTKSGAWIKSAKGESGPGVSMASVVKGVDAKESPSPHDAAGDRSNLPHATPLSSASPLDLLAASDPVQERDDIRKLTPSSRRRQPQQPSLAAAPVPDAIESTIQRATQAADKTVEALNKLELITDRVERRSFFSSIGAYVLFCVILSLGLYFALNYRASAKYAYNAVDREQYEKLLNAKKILEAEYEKDNRASTEAYEVYQLIERGSYEESIERYVKIRADLTHPAEAALLEQKIDAVRWRLADNAYHDGLILFREDNLEQARDAFFKSLSYKANTAYSHLLYYYLGKSLYQLGDFAGARSYFEKAQQSELGSELDANARFYRAAAAEKVGDVTDACTQYDQFLKKYRYHRYADEATKRRAKLEKQKTKD